MAKKPRAADFVTYLCYSRTPILSQQLEILTKGKTAATPATQGSSTESVVKEVEAGTSTSKDEGGKKAKKVAETSTKPDFIPFGVRKRAEQVPDKKQKTVEALRKKYHDQRVAKLKSKGGFPAMSSSIRTRSNMTKNPPKEDENEEKAEKADKAEKPEKAEKAEKKEEVKGNTGKRKISTRSSGSQKDSNGMKLMDVKVVVKKEIVEKKLAEQKDQEVKSARVTRQMVIRNPSMAIKEVKSEDEEAPGQEEDDFSSDDEKPLVNSLEKPTKKGKQAKVPKEDAKKPKDLVKKELPPKKTQAKKVPEKRKKVEKKVEKPPPESEEESQVSEKVVKQTKNKISKKELENLSQTATEGSENDTKATRPTRKTKEAATIYMELIGRKLNLKESDDEANESLDSYPELPNVRKTEQMENELKQNVGKNKSQSPEKVSPVRKPPPSRPEDTPTPAEKRKRPEAKGTKNPAKKSPTGVKELEKSFSDSDEEPLAVKIVKKKRPSPEKKKQLFKEEDLAVFSPTRVTLLPEDQPSPIPECEIPKISPKNDTTDDILNLSFTTFKSPASPAKSLPVTPDVTKTTVSDLDQSFVKPLTLLKPKQEVQLIQKTLDQDSRKFDPLPPKKAITASLASAQGTSKTSPQAIASLMNPLPSKEESGKIFGIASVSLAQSSGPQDTKCTLGKCGSVHKPPLGPAVPTEALLGDSGANRERRKSKVVLSHSFA